VPLDAGKFYAAKQIIDCERCTDCALFTAACEAACGAEPVTGVFPEQCLPSSTTARCA
jgi:hypothetical protein